MNVQMEVQGHQYLNHIAVRCFDTGSLTKLNSAGWTASSQSSCLHLSVLRSQIHIAMASFLHGCWGFELGP